MDNPSFIKLLEDIVKGSRIPDSFTGLSAEEEILAIRIHGELEKAKAYKNYSGIYLQALSGTEKFYDMSIRALSALIKVGKIEEEVKDVYTLCKKTLEIFAQELEFENCSIMLKDTDNEHLILMAGRGRGDKYISKNWKKGRRIKIGEGVAGKVAETGEYIFISDVQNDPRFKQFNMSVEITSLLSIPLKSDEKILGVINFSHPLLEAFDENKINLMVILSNFVSQMIMLAMLHNKIAHWNDDLRKQIEDKTSELTEKNRKLEKLAVQDPLTGLYNRRFFFTRLEEEFSRSARYNEHFSLLLIDLDNLKPVNDTYGHLAGDKVIRSFAKSLKGIGRKGDVIARIGGDEFGYILLETDQKGAHDFAERIHESFAKVNHGPVKPTPTVSIGIAHSITKKFKKHQEVFKAADDDLYKSKKKKKIK
ncbi:MAG: sensor domain-containing diguanylate cyclase [Nitrospirae bacterium]|nr:sensor domain-containing diguanylate cyclase [Nitrospirota bacterium]